MENEECFEVFRKGIDCFSYDSTYFSYLEKLRLDDLMISPNYYIVTPLLVEMFNYALVKSCLNLEYIMEESNDDRVSLYRKMDAITDACNYYLSNLYEAGCDHPTILKFNAIDSSYLSYDVMMEFISLMTEMVSEDKKRILIDFLDLVDEDIILQEDKQLESVTDAIKNIKDDYKFIRYLAEQAYLIILRKGMLMDENSVVYEGPIDNSIVRYGKNMKEFYLSNMISQRSLFDEDSSLELSDCVYGLKHSYELYKSYQYNYFKNQQEEGKILEKCKKM